MEEEEPTNTDWKRFDDKFSAIGLLCLRSRAKSESSNRNRKVLKGGVAMKSRLGFALFLLVSLVPLISAGYNDRGDTLVRFKGGIGVDPISNVTVSGTTITASPNTVRGVSPPAQIWRIAN